MFKKAKALPEQRQYEVITFINGKYKASKRTPRRVVHTGLF